MGRPSLRVLSPDHNHPTLDIHRTDEPNITVSVAQILPLLAEAMASNRAWLKDFADDPVAITSDFYEVLLAFQRLRSSNAA